MADSNPEPSTPGEPDNQGGLPESAKDAAGEPETKDTAAEPAAGEAQPTASERPADSGEKTEAASSDSATGESTLPEQVELHQHHVSKLLDAVLEEPEEAATPRKFKHPMVLDIALGMGLLVAMGGFTIGMFKMYLTHNANQSITQGNYKAAIAILQGLPLPGFFEIPMADHEDLLSKALYLDALDKLDNEDDVDGAVQELQKIKPGSRYFGLAQEIIKENFEPSSTMLKLGTEHVETNPDKPTEAKPLLPVEPQQGSQ